MVYMILEVTEFILRNLIGELYASGHQFRISIL
jgi:hypothetical protein